MTFEEALVSVWRQALVDEADAVEVGGEKFPVRRTASGRLRQVDFKFEGREYSKPANGTPAGSWSLLTAVGDAMH